MAAMAEMCKQFGKHTLTNKAVEANREQGTLKRTQEADHAGGGGAVQTGGDLRAKKAWRGCSWVDWQPPQSTEAGSGGRVVS